MMSKCPDESLRMRGMDLFMCILRMLEDTFTLGVAQFIITSMKAHLALRDVLILPYIL